MALTKIDLLIPPSGDAYAPVAVEYAHPYVAAFADAGLAITLREWTSPAVGRAPALALFVWGYHLLPERWLALLDGWPTNVPLFNPPALMRWNMRKTYLAELEASGVPTVPTWFGDADHASIGAAFERFDVAELIVKPQVSAGSHDTYRLKPGDARPKLASAMIQPFLPAIQAEGEYSLFFIGGEPSHAIRKRATGGDFRIQPQFGGENSRWTPDGEALAVAAMAIATAPPGALYARVDLLRRLDGRLALIEFEAIEPDLYPDHGDCVIETLAQAIVAAL